MDEVPREHFVEPDFLDAAYADQALPIACGQTISQPYVVAYMTEQLGVRAAAPRARDRHRLGLSGRRAVAAGARGGHASSATARWRRRRARGLQTLGYHNVEVGVGDGLAGVPTGRRSTASSSPPRPRMCRRRWSTSSPRTASCCCRSGRTTGAAAGEADQDRQTASSSEDLIAVRFVPLLPGQARSCEP